MNNKQTMQNTVTTETVTRRELIEQAIRATDAYLGIEKEATKRGFAVHSDIVDFAHYVHQAQDALFMLGEDVANQHHGYITKHINTMLNLSGNPQVYMRDIDITQKSPPVSNIDEGKSVHNPDYKIHKQAEDTLEVVADRHDLDSDKLAGVYSRGVAAQKRGEIPKHTKHQAGMHRVDKYIEKTKDEGNIVKHVNEEKTGKHDTIKIDPDDLDKDVKSLDWHDIIDLYDEEELIDEKDVDKEADKKKINEGLSATERIKRRATFARYAGKRDSAKKIKLRKASDMSVLKKRAKLAARRLLLKRLLRGRNKSDLSADEKTRIENTLSRMGTLQTTLANKLVPRIREIEKSRLSGQRSGKPAGKSNG